MHLVFWHFPFRHVQLIQQRRFSQFTALLTVVTNDGDGDDDDDGDDDCHRRCNRCISSMFSLKSRNICFNISIRHTFSVLDAILVVLSVWICFLSFNYAFCYCSVIQTLILRLFICFDSLVMAWHRSPIRRSGLVNDICYRYLTLSLSLTKTIPVNASGCITV